MLAALMSRTRLASRLYPLELSSYLRKRDVVKYLCAPHSVPKIPLELAVKQSGYTGTCESDDSWKSTRRVSFFGIPVRVLLWNSFTWYVLLNFE